MNLQSSPTLPNGANEQTFILAKYIINSNEQKCCEPWKWLMLLHHQLKTQEEALGLNHLRQIVNFDKLFFDDRKILSFTVMRLTQYSWRGNHGWDCHHTFRVLYSGGLWHFCDGQFSDPAGWIFLLLLYLHYPDPPGV